MADLLNEHNLFSPGPALAREALASGRIMARALSAAEEEADARLAIARGFCAQVVAAYWQEIGGTEKFRSIHGVVELAPLADSASVLAENLGKAAGELDAECAVHQIGLLYNVMLPPAWRSAHGVYYTPPELTERLLHQAGSAGVDWRTCRVLDPACGGGAFLAPVAQRMVNALGDCAPAILLQNIGARLHGYEIDPFAAWLSQVAVDAVLLPYTRRAGRRLQSLVTVCDTLARELPDKRFDLVVGNPPYGRISLSEERRRRFRRTLYGHANLYGLFTDIALGQVKDGGVIAYVSPTSFLAGGYFKNLRRTLAAEAPPVSFDFIDARKGVFEDVLQETLLACYRMDGERRSAAAYKLTAGENRRLHVHRAGDFSLPADASGPWLVPRTAAQGDLIRQAFAMQHRLADWGYKVSTGPLVWNRHKKQLRNAPGDGRFPLIWAEAVTGEGRFVFRAEKRNHLPYFAVTARDGWLVIDAPCVLLQRTTAKEQRRRLVAAELPAGFLREHGGAVVENHLNMIRTTMKRPKVSPKVLTAFLNSGTVDAVFRCLSGSVAVSAYELEALPLPAPDAMKPLAALVRAGAPQQRIEKECARLYGFTPDEGS
ncbi:HsdM family class I SAM-dependent methyltransferase [Thiohalomonas denitrificans]|uniref:HsdM family class I SAM-dependent methyltransferase n=1 Tax=Thiohalomonas denitrificans TaxID=415747 RepID=UPI0026ED5EF9|nr:N-6 DNA methylase [Thiohalomonas denitrificans]